MKKTVGWMKNNREKLWFAIVLNALVLAAMLLWMRPWYETNDDINIAVFANGALGTFDPHVIFQNYFLGMVYSKFYSIFGARFPWYALFQYFVLFVSFTGITHILLKKFKNWEGFALTGLLLIYFGFEGYIHIQFTKTAGIATAAGIFLLFFAAEQPREQRRMGWLLGVVGMLLTLAGSMIRYQEFLACTALMTGIGVLLVLTLNRLPKGKRFKRLLRYCAVFGMMMALALSARAFNTYIYEKDEAWNQYTQYNQLRARLLDLGFPAYGTYQEEYEKLGINADAYRLYTAWGFNDPEKFNVEVMEKLLEIAPKRELNMEVVQEFFKDYPGDFVNTPVFFCFLFLLAAWLLWGVHGWRQWAAVLYETVLFLGMYLFLYYQGRYGVNRVDVALWFSVCLLFLWLLFEKKKRLESQTCAVFLMTVLIFNQTNWSEMWRANVKEEDATKVYDRQMMEIIAADREHLYLAKVGTLNCGNYGPFDRVPVGLLDNIAWLGGWEVTAPPVTAVMEKYGVANPYRDAIDNDKVYIVDNEIDLTMRYINAYYDEDAEAELVKEMGNYKIYQIQG